MLLSFSTKARTLAALSGKVESAQVPSLVCFQFIDWEDDRVECLSRIGHDLETESFIVRSSCRREDGENSSNAGAFLSLANISADGLEDAIERVIEAKGRC